MILNDIDLSYRRVILANDFATLVNDRQSCDIELKVGGSDTAAIRDSIGKNSYDTSTAVTLYAHSAILRCRSKHFANLLDKCEEKVIHMPVSSTVIQEILYFIYTGSMHTPRAENLLELISVGENMKLEDVSIECQTKVIVMLRKSVQADVIWGWNNTKNADKKTRTQYLPIEEAICILLIPGLMLAYQLELQNFFDRLLAFTIRHIDIILTSPRTCATFFNKIQSQILIQILASDSLAIPEYSVWELAFDWSCQKVEIMRCAIEKRLKEEMKEDGYLSIMRASNSYFSQKETAGDNTQIITERELTRFKETIQPLLPKIRFSLLTDEQYSNNIEILGYILPTRRSFNLQKFFATSKRPEPFDRPRIQTEVTDDRVELGAIVDSTPLKEWIFKAGGIPKCPSAENLLFKLLFRASDHNFLATSFHLHCDNKGPTLVIVKSIDGHLFGGVNFANWESTERFSGSVSNFLFSLADGYYRKNSTIFKYRPQGTGPTFMDATFNSSSFGPVFGGLSDLCIVDSSHKAYSHSRMPVSYNGVGASVSALAGEKIFRLTDYHVYAISNMNKDVAQYL